MKGMFLAFKKFRVWGGGSKQINTMQYNIRVETGGEG